MPSLRCLIGPSPSQLTPIPINSSKSHYVSSDLWEGNIAVFVKFDSSHSHLHPSSGSPSHSRRSSRGNSPTSEKDNQKHKVFSSSNVNSEGVHEYFERAERAGVTWSIQVQGRFKKPYDADSVLFGNTFDRPLHLPWGSGAALKFMHFIDPTLTHDLSGPKPWALSPLITTMPYFNHRRLHSPSSSASPSHPHRHPEFDLREYTNSFPPEESIEDDISQLSSIGGGGGSAGGESPKGRRNRFHSASKRKEVIFGPEDLITTDFCYGFLKFPSLTLSLPAGVSFDLKKYWDGQPVRFVCCERNEGGPGESGAAEAEASHSQSLGQSLGLGLGLSERLKRHKRDKSSGSNSSSGSGSGSNSASSSDADDDHNTVKHAHPHPHGNGNGNRTETTGRTFWVVQFEIWEDGDGVFEEREPSLIDPDEDVRPEY